MTRLLGSLVACLLALTLAPGSQAEPPALDARLECARLAAPGRVVCELTTEARVGKLVWSDALVVSAPAFARPLRSRVVAPLTPGTGEARTKLALVATQLGTGTLALLARGVICREGPAGESCQSESTPVSSVIEVGAQPAP
jgi:hypothetical protein